MSHGYFLMVQSLIKCAVIAKVVHPKSPQRNSNNFKQLNGDLLDILFSVIFAYLHIRLYFIYNSCVSHIMGRSKSR